MIFQDLMELKDVFFIGLTEPKLNSLRVIFSKSISGDTPEQVMIGKTSLDAYPINVDENEPLIQIEFERYIAYSVRNESYTSWDEYEEFEGKVFRIYRKSRYLDFIGVSTFATEDFPGPFKHYGICCLDHIVDIVSVSEPIVSEIED
ncbi:MULTISPECIES: hypothetical protein [Paenibacillus]|uniref:hypothetical protein n=1 Tax=Paenibacillus TaxID=44249 RepID=UPI0022B8E0FD|nr:hypothetical protein [Paenibacillus caseinilyticus]MCZ8520962.1 hypothetical protein [Paenibacillus caseinilyticus]